MRCDAIIIILRQFCRVGLSENFVASLNSIILHFGCRLASLGENSSTLFFFSLILRSVEAILVGSRDVYDTVLQALDDGA